MIQRRVLFLDHSGLSAWRITGSAAQKEGEFVAHTEGIEAFTRYLHTCRGSLFLLLVNLAEESFQIEEIPFSRGRDRAAIVRRKLGQHGYDTPFSLAVSQGRGKTGRRDERLLLMALTASLIDPWLAALRSCQSILAGIHSVPQILHHLLPSNAPAQTLLITQCRTGLRQSFFIDGQLRFSRLTHLTPLTPLKPNTASSAEEVANAVSIEAGRMHQYLSSQRLIDRNKPLATCILAHPAYAAAVREHCRSQHELEVGMLDLLQSASRTGLKSIGTDPCVVALLCHLVVCKTPAEQFAPPTQRQYFRLWQARIALTGTSAVLLVASLLFAAWVGIETVRMQDETDMIRQQAMLDRQQYDAILQTLPPVPMSQERLRALTDRYDQLMRRAIGPAPLLVQLSRSLDAFPVIEIEQIEWRIADELPPLPQEAGQPLAVPPHMASGPYALVTVFASLPVTFAGDHRRQLKLVADFTRHLNEAPNSLAMMLSTPFDIESGKTIKSADTTGAPEAPRFSFLVAHKL